jgi:hypothetical protein
MSDQIKEVKTNEESAEKPQETLSGEETQNTWEIVYRYLGGGM